MIRFNCPYCGNEFAVRDTYAGRDGWCRVCKELVLVPTEDGKGPHLDDLPMEDRLGRLRAKLKYAATQADTFKQIALRIWTETDALLLGRDIKDRKLTPEGIEASLAAWRAAWEAREAEAATPLFDTEKMAQLQTEVSELRTALEQKSRAFADANEEAERLRAAVAALEADQAQQLEQAGLAVADGSVAHAESNALREELEAARSALADLEGIKSETERLLNEVRAELAAAQVERDNAQRARQVLQDEVESLRVELDAALFAKADGDEASQLAQGREAVLREDLTETRLKLADADARRTESESALRALGERLSAAEAERDEAQQATRVLQDEIAGLRVELDAALHATGPDVSPAVEPMANEGFDGDEPAFAVAGYGEDGARRDDGARDGARDKDKAPVWHDAPVVVAQPNLNVGAPAEEMELVEAEIEGLEPFENDAMMASYLHFLSDVTERGK